MTVTSVFTNCTAVTSVFTVTFSRNKCIHGVLCGDNRPTDQQEHDDNDDCDDEGQCLRETLNLRYGLHSPEFAREEVDQHWSE